MNLWARCALPILQVWQDEKITFAALDASVNGWVNHVRLADTWGLRKTVFRRLAARTPDNPPAAGDFDIDAPRSEDWPFLQLESLLRCFSSGWC
jgi:hypothetical protein